MTEHISLVLDMIFDAQQRRDVGGLTSDEIQVRLGLIDSEWDTHQRVSPLTTGLRKAGLVRRTGDRRTTRLGGTAHVLALTPRGMRAARKGK